MRIEALCTGDELLTGLIVDTNTPFFAARLLELGEQLAAVRVAGDDRAEIARALLEATSRADVLLVSGGLGPTADDVTLEAAAEAAGVDLVEDPETLVRLRERFARFGRELTPNNARQARIPRGATALPNRAGTAPMVLLTLGKATVFFLPGVPREYRHLLEAEVLPRIRTMRERLGSTDALAFTLLRTIALPESHLDARVAPLVPRHPKVTFGFRTQAPENHLKLLARAPTTDEARAALEAAALDCEAVLGDHFFGRGEEVTLATVVMDLLRRRGETVGAAESCTGGMICALLTDPPGASDVFRGGEVTYTDELKRARLGIPPELLARHGAVSAEVAEAMASGARAVCGTDWGLSATGYAGPSGGDERNAVGTVFLGLAGPGVLVHERHQLGHDRERVRSFASHFALDLLRRALLDKNKRA